MIGRSSRSLAPTAPWSLRFALLPLPLLIVAGSLRHLSMIDLVPLLVVVTLAWCLSGAALIAAAVAFRAIWIDGRLGFGRALTAVVLAVAVLALPATIVVEMFSLPRLTDISTDRTDPPAFADSRPLPSASDQAAQQKAYPDIVPRHYPVSPERVFVEIDKLIAARGWTVVDRAPPDADNALGSIEAEAKTFGFAFPVDVALRLEADEDGTLVDMRSASHFGAHDLGDNARRIRAFFADLDAALQGVTEPADSGDNENLPPLPLAPPPR